MQKLLILVSVLIGLNVNAQNSINNPTRKYVPNLTFEINVRQTAFEGEDAYFGNPSGQKSTTNTIKITTAFVYKKLGISSGLGVRSISTYVDYATRAYSNQSIINIPSFIDFGFLGAGYGPIPKTVSAVDLNTKYLMVPLLFEVGNRNKGFGVFVRSELEFNILINSSREVSVEENRTYMNDSKIGTEIIQSEKFKSYFQHSLQIGFNYYSNYTEFKVGIGYHNSIKDLYGGYGGVKSSFSLTFGFQIFLLS